MMSLERTPVRLEERIVDVHIEDRFVVGELGDKSVGGVILLTPLVVIRGSAGENRQEENLHLRLLLPEQLHDLSNALRSLLGAASVNGSAVLFHCAPLVSSVVGTDHENGKLSFRLEAVVVTILQSPENVLGAIAADAEIRGFEGRPMFGPNFLASSFPTGRDGITEEDKRSFALL